MFESGVPGACFSICLFVCPELRYQMAREQRAETSPQQRMVGRKHPWPTAEPRSFGRDWMFPLTSKCFCRKKGGCFSTFGRVSLPQSYRSGDGWQLGLTFWGLESGFKMFQAGHPRSSQIIPPHRRRMWSSSLSKSWSLSQQYHGEISRDVQQCSTCGNSSDLSLYICSLRGMEGLFLLYSLGSSQRSCIDSTRRYKKENKGIERRAFVGIWKPQKALPLVTSGKNSDQESSSGDCN